jgi:pyruvate formate lyase activating enzyme
MDIGIKGLISDIQKFSIHDGPGIRTTVFLKGCPLGCLWCGNPETISALPEIMFSDTACMGCWLCLEACRCGALETVHGQPPQRNRDLCKGCGDCAGVCPKNALLLRGKPMSAEAVFIEIEKDLPFYSRSGGGVTLSGGEPFLQADFIKALLKMSKERGIHTAVDTGGYAKWSLIEQSMAYIDLFLYDLKHVDPVKHKKGTTVSNGLILENLQKLLKSGKEIVLRLPLIPDFNTSRQDLEQIAAFAGNAGAKELRILPYHQYGRGKYKKLGKKYALDGLQLMAEEDVEQAKKILEKYIPKVIIGG